MRSKRALAAIGVAAVVAASACTIAGVGKYPAAGIFAGTAIGATGVNRAVNGGCWSSCPYGRVCDHDSGFCVEPERESPLPPTRLPVDAGEDDAPDGD